MSTGLKKTIDVVIPVHNGEHFIVQAIKSVERQIYRPDKIIIIDDGSTDRTESLIKSHQAIIPIQYIKKVNGGLSSARNEGIKLATSEYIAFLDADDEWYPDKLEKQIDKFKTSSFSNIGVIYCQYNIINEDGVIANKHFILKADPDIRGNIFKKLLLVNMITGSGSGVLIKRKCFESVGLFDENLRACEDWDMWLRIAQKYEFDYVDKVLVKIRRHYSNMQNDNLRMFSNTVLFYKKWMEILPSADIPEGWYKNIVMKSLRRLPETDFMRLLMNLPRNLKKEITSVIRQDKKFIAIQAALTPFYIIKNIFNRLQFGKKNTSGKIRLRASRNSAFIYTEIYGCGKIGKIALESFYMHHPNTQVHIFGTLKDFKWIERRENFIYHDISNETKILNNFNYGHLGTASLWAKIILEREERYIIHFDSDVIFRTPIINELEEKLKSGYDIVGPIRNYQHNPNHRNDVRYLSDVSQTMCFGFNKEMITERNYEIMTKMCQGSYNPFNHPVIDFFDPIMFDILRNGGSIYYLDHNNVGGCDYYGKRTNKHIGENSLIDFGDKLAHFSSVGSGMYYHNHNNEVKKNVPASYVNYALEKYAVFCKIFYNEDIGIEYDKEKYRPLFEVKNWYNGD